LLWGGWQERLRHGREQENWTYAIDLGHQFIDNGGIKDVSKKRNAKPERPLSSGKIE